LSTLAKRDEVAAPFYSLIESAKRAGVDPTKYLRAAVEASLREERALLLLYELRAAPRDARSLSRQRDRCGARTR
jgi:hypothetical protein